MAIQQQRADARRNREAIVAAATELFASVGIDCQMAEIARRAGVGHGTVFRHFPAKRDLVMAVAEARMAEMLAMAKEAADAADPTRALASLLERITRMQIEDRGFKQMASEHFHGDPRLVETRDELLALVGRLIDRCKGAGTIRQEIEPVDLVVLLNGVASGVAEFEELCPGVHRRYVALALAGLRPGPGTERPLDPPAPTAAELDEVWRREALHGCSPDTA
jgi:AcrR family transcriptional regulator